MFQIGGTIGAILVGWAMDRGRAALVIAAAYLFGGLCILGMSLAGALSPALTAIVFSASVENDPSLQLILKDATERIDWVLTTVLPDGEEGLKWPVQRPQWRPVAWRAR